ncbi:MAG: two pore domain potassium channel family protein [Eubacterium sp.]|nr:two pore domain potassium channel family protein [Eubacterium sp.]
MKKAVLLWRIMKRTGFIQIFTSYLIFFLITALLLRLKEPGIETYGDGIWYCFVVSATIGFGDIVAVTTIGRILTIILAVYSVAVTAIFTATIANYYMNMIQLRANESAEAFLDQLEHLPDLTPEELAALSEKIKHFKSSHDIR